MAQRPEDFNLPLSAIRKILQDSMPSDVVVTDGAKLALSKAASVFILYVTTAANAFSQDNKRKRVLGKDVFDALADLDLGFLVPSLRASLNEYHNSLGSKKQAKEERKSKDSEAECVEESFVPEEIIVLDSDSEDGIMTLDSNSGNSSDNVEEMLLS